jgi:hypothetical protein
MKKIILPLITVVTFAAATISVRADDTNTVPATVAPDTASAPATASAADLKPGMSEDEWQFGLNIPLWAPQINGNVTVRGHQQNTDVSFNQLKEHLDAVFSTAIEAHKGKFSLYGDVGYMKFSVDQTFPDGHVKASAGLKFLYSDVAAGYQLIKTESEHPFLLEGTVGVRYWYASMPVKFKDDGGTVLFSGSKTWNLVDPVLGFRGSQYFTEKFHLDFQGDGGGFNISHNTDWTWGATAALSYDFAKWFTASAGYQALALDESEGSGVGKDGKNGLNLIFNGALVELNFHF